MRALEPHAAARLAAGASPSRPGIAILLDAPDVRLVVFKIAPGQAVAPHRNASTVMLTVLEGEGVLSGGDGERQCAAGEMVVYEPSELHGMRAVDTELLLLATITPHPSRRGAS